MDRARLLWPGLSTREFRWAGGWRLRGCFRLLFRRFVTCERGRGRTGRLWRLGWRPVATCAGIGVFPIFKLVYSRTEVFMTHLLGAGGGR